MKDAVFKPLSWKNIYIYNTLEKYQLIGSQSSFVLI
jgi:hypothetical protein